MEKQNSPFITPGAIVVDPDEPGGPIQLWVDWDSNVDHPMGMNRQGQAWVEGKSLIVAGGRRARRFDGLNDDVINDIKKQGGSVITANISGVVSQLDFPGFAQN